MFELRSPTAADREALTGWFPDADALHLFAGPSLAWPLTVEQLQDLERTPGLAAWTVAETGAATAGAAPTGRPVSATPDDPTSRAPAIGRFDLSLRHHVGSELEPPTPTAHLGRVIVAPERRGQGLARELLRLAVARARRDGAAELSLNVAEGNAPAIRAYLRAGFRPRPSNGGIIPMTLAL